MASEGGSGVGGWGRTSHLSVAWRRLLCFNSYSKDLSCAEPSCLCF